MSPMHRGTDADQSKAIRIMLSVAGAFILMDVVVGWLPTVWHNPDIYRDAYWNYYLGARDVLEGRPLYTPWPEYGPYIHASPEHRMPPGRLTNPPSLHVATALFGLLPYVTFARVWYVLILLGILGYAACLAHLATGRLTWPAFSVALTVLAMVPWTVRVFARGNIDPVLWALFGLALVSVRLRGGMFAAVALAKVHTLWPLALASWHDRARIYVPAAIVLLAGFLLGSLAPGGVGAWVSWVRYALPGMPAQGTFNVDNVSLSFAGLRLARLLGWHYEIGPLPSWARLYLTTMGLGAPLLTIWLARRLDHVLQYACVTAAAVLFAPLCWSCYLSYPLAAVALAYRSYQQRREASTAVPAEAGDAGLEAAGGEG